MKTTKKMAALGLSAVLALGVAGCADDADDNAPAQTETIDDTTSTEDSDGASEMETETSTEPAGDATDEDGED